jgi:C-terminal processing protease CtpA/Prc
VKTLLPIVTIIVFAVSLLSCEESFLREESANSATEVFDLVWKDLDEHYSGFVLKSKSWDSLYQVYRPMITTQSSSIELWETLTAMLEELDDEHVKLFDKVNDRVFASGHKRVEAAQAEFNLELVASDYLEDIGAVNNYLLYGRIADTNIGYIYLAALLDENYETMAQALHALSDVGADQALVIDIRNCIGGYDGLAAQYAAYFSDGEHHLYNSQFRNGSTHQQLTEAVAYRSHASVAPNFRAPVVLLTDVVTASEGEIFALNLRSFSHVTHWGDTTAGALSLVSSARFLPNGWRYEYSIQLITNPDGSSYEGQGIPPNYWVRNEASDIAAGRDRVLEKAIEYLQAETE